MAYWKAGEQKRGRDALAAALKLDPNRPEAGADTAEMPGRRYRFARREGRVHGRKRSATPALISSMAHQRA